MSDSGKIELTRRKILASMGAVGAAGAGAGLGTSALFNDTEGFDGNTITAGQLDLKMDWEEHYSYPQIYDGFDDPTDGLEVTRTEPEDTSDYTAFPPGVEADEGVDPLVWVKDEDVPAYMTETTIEAFPDDPTDEEVSGGFPVEVLMPDKDPCEVLADVPTDLSRYAEEGEQGEVVSTGRTKNADTHDGEESLPLINLEDVKPGDFGEITFSTHLCDNPAYLWMQMPGGLTLEENGVTEPEADSSDEDQVEGEGNPGPKEDGGTQTVELADNVETAIWYDGNCDNLVTNDQKIDILALADTSGSQTESDMADLIDAGNTFIDALPWDETADDGELLFQGGLLEFGDGVDLLWNIGDPENFDTDGDGSADLGDRLPSEGAGGTPMPHALDIGSQILDDQGRSDARQVILMVTDGLPNLAGGEQSANTFTAQEVNGSTQYSNIGTYTGLGDFGEINCPELEEVERIASDIKTADGNIVSFSKGPKEIIAVGVDIGDTDCDVSDFGPAPSGSSGTLGGDTFLANFVASSTEQFFDAETTNLNTVATRIAQQLTADEVIFQGTLREAESALTSGDHGLPLDALRGEEDGFDEDEDSDDGPEREAFQPFNTACFGFSWWVPEDVGNEIQSDKAMFNLGFYAEQARNNDGSGSAPS
jgi:predicted ribosomally synthesized peptide with SipW-like signal peptide